jgi:hypothetical protein
MGYQTVRALTTVRHDGKLRIPGQTTGDNAQDFIVEDSWATKLIAAGFVSAVGAASAPIELRPVLDLKAQYQNGVFVGLQTNTGDSVGTGGPTSGITQAQADARYASINQYPKQVTLASGVAYINNGTTARTVTISAGVVSAVSVASASAPSTYIAQGSTSGDFTVPAGGQIKVDWSVQPTVVIS